MHKSNALEQAAEKANTLRKVNADMKDWEALNEYESCGHPCRSRSAKSGTCRKADSTIALNANPV